MAGSVNKVILVGNLGKDPEIRRTQDGRPIANLRIATSDTWRDKATGERREKTEWHSVVIFNENLCKIAEQYLKKGSKVFIEGVAADAQVAGPGRPGPLLDRGRAAGLQRQPDDARRPRGRRRRGCRCRRTARPTTAAARRRATAMPRARKAAKGGAAIDKQLDDEIPF